MQQIAPQDILDFWYSQALRTQWFASTPQLDATIKERYAALLESAQSGTLDHWRDSATGCLALAIILDQFPLHIFRGTAQSFATEKKSIDLVKNAISQGFDSQIDKTQVAFLYMPLMHSENLADQDTAVALFTAAGLENNLRFALHHRELVRRFGRFPHRNTILGRISSAEEQAYLASKEAFKG